MGLLLYFSISVVTQKRDLKVALVASMSFTPEQQIIIFDTPAGPAVPAQLDLAEFTTNCAIPKHALLQPLCLRRDVFPTAPHNPIMRYTTSHVHKGQDAQQPCS